MNERQVLRQIFQESTPAVPIGPGDDMALLRPEGWSFGERGGGGLLAAVDQVVAGVHFDPGQASLGEIGRKAITRCLSDVAAMAGRPMASLVAAVLPEDMSDEQAMELFRAMQEVAQRYRAPIVGGDLGSHREVGHPMVCSVTVLAEATSRGAVTRFGANPGDLVCVTGELGGAVESGRHLNFEPRIGEAIMLHAILEDRLHAMIDVSDGLGSDAARILERDDSLQIRIDGHRLPCATGIRWPEAVSDGEDYELLCIVAPGDIPQQLLECPVSVIGRVQERDGDDARLVVVEADGQEHDVTDVGWEHAT
jgi:thiamine-monophosphate kinase